ncbi:MAG: hypothetical protein HY670_04030 [Chloroflexi bacterium]|nr:hypothetical protein [Chloroflexota bacterium]
MKDENGIPAAIAWGELQIGDAKLPCYVLGNETRDRVFSLKGVVVGLIETEGGQLAEYVKVSTLRPFLPKDLVPAENDIIPALIKFDTGGKGPFRYASGLRVEKFMDLCTAYSLAAEKSQLTPRQATIAANANQFLRACAKVGIIALVDEATGYQERRPEDELQFKLNLYLADFMRKWEKTFPDELWEQFGRLTGWAKPSHQRPKYWGHLVIELVYKYLDPDVAQWLQDNAPKPRHHQNYHQWLTSQYGLQRLVEHIWKLIGVASTCGTMDELRYRMKELYGDREPFQYRLALFGHPALPQREAIKRLSTPIES